MLAKGLSLLSLGLGIFVLVQVVMPMAAYKIWEISLNNQNSLLADPIPNQTAVLGISVESHDNFPAIISLKKREVEPSYKDFMVSIPAINLMGAKAVVDTNDFDTHLGHLPGSALPGERGNVFITGHSSLTQLFRQDNYKAIFAFLPNIKKGDEIRVEADGVTYKYIVESQKIVAPSEVWVVNPPDSVGRYLSLMTCVPPGFNTKRLVVLAKLQS